MATLQKFLSSCLLGTLAASCLLLVALWVQGGVAAPLGSHCRLDESDFQQPYIINRTFKLADEVVISTSLAFISCLLGTQIVLTVFFRTHLKSLRTCHLSLWVDQRSFPMSLHRLFRGGALPEDLPSWPLGYVHWVLPQTEKFSSSSDYSFFPLLLWALF